jgi:hypothetical protein
MGEELGVSHEAQYGRETEETWKCGNVETQETQETQGSTGASERRRSIMVPHFYSSTLLFFFFSPCDHDTSSVSDGIRTVDCANWVGILLPS